jgi:hypothetical protein
MTQRHGPFQVGDVIEITVRATVVSGPDCPRLQVHGCGCEIPLEVAIAALERQKCRWLPRLVSV